MIIIQEMGYILLGTTRGFNNGEKCSSIYVNLPVPKLHTHVLYSETEYHIFVYSICIHIAGIFADARIKYLFATCSYSLRTITQT